MGGRSTVMCSNLTTGKMNKKSHHCIECKTAATSNCYKEKHVAYCDFPVNNNLSGTCNVRFNVKARGGCGKHPYHTGANQRVRQERRHLDPEFKSEEELETEEYLRQQETAAAEAEAEHLRSRPHDTDWSRPEEPLYKEKRVPRERAKKGGRK